MKAQIERYQVIGIVGLAKNTGKTTTLNHLLKVLKGEKIAITSIGLDGEEIDQVTFLPKPRIHVLKGTFIATARSCLKASEITYKIIKETPYQSALGNICIIEALSDGFVLVAGPTSNLEMSYVVSILKKYANKVFIDGAFDRKTFANISEIEAIILSTGASVSPDIDETVHKTIHAYRMFNLPLAKSYPFATHAKMIIMTADKTHYAEEKNHSTLKEYLPIFRKSIKKVYFQGAITKAIPDFFIKHQCKNFTLVGEDATKFLFSEKTAEYLNHLNITLKVLKQCPILFITINPTNPKGKNYNEIEFVSKLSRAVKIPILNVRSRSDDDVELE